MSKLHLSIESLEVQSFATQEASVARGTVLAREVVYGPAPTQDYQSCRACESGMCLGTLEDACFTAICNSGFPTRCEPIEPLSADPSCLTCVTCPGLPGC